MLGLAGHVHDPNADIIWGTETLPKKCFFRADFRHPPRGASHQQPKSCTLPGETCPRTEFFDFWLLLVYGSCQSRGADSLKMRPTFFSITSGF